MPLRIIPVDYSVFHVAQGSGGLLCHEGTVLAQGDFQGDLIACQNLFYKLAF